MLYSLYWSFYGIETLHTAVYIELHVLLHTTNVQHDHRVDMVICHFELSEYSYLLHQYSCLFCACNGFHRYESHSFQYFAALFIVKCMPPQYHIWESFDTEIYLKSVEHD